MRCKIITLFVVILSIGLVSAVTDVSVFQGQYYNETDFIQGTFTFEFDVYDAETEGNLLSSSVFNVTTGTWGQWRVEVDDLSRDCVDESKDYFIEITIDGEKQGDRKRLTHFMYLRKDINDTTTGSLNALALSINDTLVCLSDGTNCIAVANGTDGVNGSQGVAGINGTDGVNGSQGVAGINGTDGAQGIQGIQGMQGEAGINGTDGIDGVNGTDGDAWFNLISGWLSYVGDLFVDGDLNITGDIYSNNAKVCLEDGTNCQSVDSSKWSENGSMIYYNDGNVGIGTDSPTKKLEVADGGLLVVPDKSLSYDSPFKIETVRNGYSDSAFSVSTSNKGGSIGLYEYNSRRIHLSGYEDSYFNNNYNLGIGTNSPSEKLDVVGNIKASGNITSNGKLVCLEDGTNCLIQNFTDTNTNCSVDGSCLSIVYESELDYTIDTSASVNCVGDQVLLGNGSCVSSSGFGDSGSGGDTASDDVFYAYDATGGITISNSWTDITWDTEVREDGDYTHNTDGKDIAINSNSWYEITFECTADVGSNSRSHIDWRILIDGNEELGSRAASYHRNSADGKGTVTVSILKQLNNGQVLSFQGMSDSASSVSTVANGCRVVIIKSDNNQGPEGPRGPAGESSTDTLQNITDRGSVTTKNITIGSVLNFLLGGFIQEFSDYFLINKNLNVTGNITSNGKLVCLEDGANCQESDSGTQYVGFISTVDGSLGRNDRYLPLGTDSGIATSDDEASWIVDRDLTITGILWNSASNDRTKSSAIILEKSTSNKNSFVETSLTKDIQGVASGIDNSFNINFNQGDLAVIKYSSGGNGGSVTDLSITLIGTYN